LFVLWLLLLLLLLLDWLHARALALAMNIGTPLPYTSPPGLSSGRFRRSLAMADAQLGCAHPYALSAAAALGACLAELGESGDWAEAEHLLRRVSYTCNASFSLIVCLYSPNVASVSAAAAAVVAAPLLRLLLCGPSQVLRFNEQGDRKAAAGRAFDAASHADAASTFAAAGAASGASSPPPPAGVAAAAVPAAVPAVEEGVPWSAASAAAAVALADMLRRARR
jgi:hypothetical protein